MQSFYVAKRSYICDDWLHVYLDALHVLPIFSTQWSSTKRHGRRCEFNFSRGAMERGGTNRSEWNPDHV